MDTTEAPTPFVYDADTRATRAHELWAQARARCPVGPAVGTGALDSTKVVYHVTHWDDVDTVLRDGDTFSASINAVETGQYMGKEFILGMDGQEHRSYRNLVAPAFRASQLNRWDETLIRPLINGCIDAIAPLGRTDLVEAVTSKYPARVICSIVGVPVEEADRFLRWADKITGAFDHETKMQASMEMEAYLAGLLAERRAHPRSDIITDLAGAEVDGEKLSDAKIFGFLKLMLPAGAETTFRAMGTALLMLVTQPGLYERVRDDRELVADLIEETLRWEASVTEVSRVAAKDTVLGGCPVPAGTPLSVFTSSANRDESRYDNADIFDIDRPPTNHVGFGTGQHQCLGMHLARLEMRIGINTILDRLPNLRLDPDAPAPEIKGFQFRGPTSIPVLFDPSQT